MHIKQILPLLQVTDLDKAIEFYKRLGFELDWAYPEEEPTHLRMTHGICAISFDKVEIGRDIKKADITLEVSGIRDFHKHLSETIEDIEALPEETSGVIEFGIEDPWGHQIVLGEYIRQENEGIKLYPQTTDQAFVFVTLGDRSPEPTLKPLMTYEEEEGTTMIIKVEEAKKYDFELGDMWAEITLGYQSDLGMVGLTGYFGSRLAQYDISCNVVAAYFHDHLFVPYERRQEAVNILSALRY